MPAVACRAGLAGGRSRCVAEGSRARSPGAVFTILSPGFLPIARENDSGPVSRVEDRP